MKGLLLLFTAAFLLPLSSKAQTILQLNSYYSSLDSKAKSTFVTEDYTTYLAGEFSGEIIIGFNYRDAALKKSIYFTKQLSNGDIPFLETFYSTGDVFVSSIISKNNEVYIGGTYTDSLFIGTDTLFNGNFKGIYVAIFDTLGNFQYSLQPEAYSAELYDMSFSPQGDLLITGEYFGTFDFDGYNLNAPLGFNMLLINYNVIDQSINWIKTSEGTATNGKSVRSDAAGNVFVTGSYGNSTTFDSQVLSEVNGDHNVFIAKYSELGSLQWVKTIISPVQAHGLGLGVTNAGEIYVTGEYEMNLDIPTIGTLSNSGLMDVFVAKMNQSGDFSWAKTIQSTQFDQGIKIALDINDNPIILSNAGSIINFEGHDMSTNGFQDPLILKLNKFNGSYIWHCRIPSAPSSGIVEANSISIHGDLISICGSNRTGIFYQNEILDSPNLDDTYWSFIRDTNNAEISVSGLTILSNDHFSVFPNPFNSIINVQSNQFINRIEIVDLNGKIVFSSFPENSFVQLEPQLMSGIYYLKIETKNTHYTSKIHKL